MCLLARFANHQSPHPPSSSVLTSILFVVTLSVGEAIYSPRVYEYTMLLAPKADEGLYTNLASIPMFVAKLFAGSISGKRSFFLHRPELCFYFKNFL